MAARVRSKWLTSVTSSPLALLMLLQAAGCSSADDHDEKVASQVTAPTQAASIQAAVVESGEVEAGKQALAQGKYQAAVDSFTRALADSRQAQLPNPGAAEAEVYYQRGVAYLQMGFPDTAAQDFTTAMNLEANRGAAYEQRARAYVELGDSYKALRDATQAIRLLTDNADAYRLRGQVYLERGQYERAAADLQYAVDRKPQLLEEVKQPLSLAYAQWSAELAAAGDQVAAAEKLAKARQLVPKRNQAEATAEVSEPAPVEQSVAKPVVDEADRQFAAGREHQLAREYDQAIIEYTEAIALRRDFDLAYLHRGETLLEMGFPDTALEDLKRAAHRGAESAELHRLEARAHMALANPHRAALAATEALHLDPTHAATYALRGEAYLQQESWQRAAADLEAIRRDPNLRQSVEGKLTTARRRQSEVQAAKLQASAER
jgi:tetratricopeptide (TPR) repeat protein